MNAFEPRATVEVLAVIPIAVEGYELPPDMSAQSEKELVEGLTPGLGVQSGAVGQNTTEVEKAEADRR